MLYSHNLEDEKLNHFTLFLDKAKNGNSDYARIVNDVLLETHQYLTGKKTLHSINRDTFNIILMLSNIEGEYFKNLSDNPQSYTKETYQHVFDTIASKKPAFAF